MNKLIEELYSCDCHFVRCIKPNSKKSSYLTLRQCFKVWGTWEFLTQLKSENWDIYIGDLTNNFTKSFTKLKLIYTATSRQFRANQKMISNNNLEKLYKNMPKNSLREYILFGSKKILIKELNFWIILNFSQNRNGASECKWRTEWKLCIKMQFYGFKFNILTEG